MLFTVSQSWLFFRFKSSKFDSAGELTVLPSSPSYEEGEGARLAPTFQTPRFSAFWASLHILSHHLTWSCPGVPNNNMTPNVIRAFQTTIISFESINGSCKHYCVSFFQQKFDKLIRMKITTRCHILKLKGTKFDFGWGSAPNTLGSLQRSRSLFSWISGAYF